MKIKEEKLWVTLTGGGTSLYYENKINDLNNELSKDTSVLRYIKETISSVEADSSSYVRVNVPIVDGYVPLLGLYSSNDVSSSIIPFISSNLITQEGKLTIGIRNISSNVIANVTVNIIILYIKSQE